MQINTQKAGSLDLIKIGKVTTTPTWNFPEMIVPGAHLAHQLEILFMNEKAP